MKIAILAALFTLATSAATAQTPIPGYDRPSTTREHQHVTYWNDSMNHYDVSMQVAADAYRLEDLYDKRDSRAKATEKRYDHKSAGKHTKK